TTSARGGTLRRSACRRQSASRLAAADSGASSPRLPGTIQSSASSLPAGTAPAWVQQLSQSALMKRSTSATGCGWPSLSQDGCSCAPADAARRSEPQRAANGILLIGGFKCGFLQWRMFPEVDAAFPLLQSLNPEQRAAVTLPNEHALILAGAGSGKTRVLTTRIAWLLSSGQVSPGGVMAVTFTNKAAKEMMTRLGAMLPLNVRGMWIGTFHGLCNRFLRAHYKLAN